MALVIGNNDYLGTSRLERAVTDARAIGTELRQVGFQVIEHSNLDRRGMNQAINELVDKAAGGGVAVLFFAGHGVQVSGTNYLLPTDIKVSRAEDLTDEAIDLGRVMDRLAQAKAKFALLIIDACRDNPFPRTAGRSIGAPRGLTIPSAPDGLMVVYSAGVNEQALDKLDATDRDPNGLFTREFLKQMRQPGVRVDEMVRRVRSSVREQAQRVGHSQNPAIYDQAQGEFYFVSPVAQAAVVAPVTTTAAAGGVPGGGAAGAAVAQSAAAKSEEAAYELAFWDAIKSTQAASDYEEYLRQFPSGRFAGLARDRRDRLLAAAVPAAEAKPTQPVQPAAMVSGAAAPAAISTNDSVRPIASAPTPPVLPAAPVVQSGVPAPVVAAPSVSGSGVQAPSAVVQPAPAPAMQAPAAVGQVAAVAPVVPAPNLEARPTGSPDIKAPTSLAAMQGKRYFGRSARYELEVEVVAGGLRVLRFGAITDSRVQYRCGVLRNEIAVSESLEIRTQTCGSSGFFQGGTENLGYYRFVSGVFPVVDISSEKILLIDASLRNRFDETLKATPSLTTESFAKAQ